MIMSPNISGTLFRRGCFEGVTENPRECWTLLEGTKEGHFSGELLNLLSLCFMLSGTRLEFRFNVLMRSFRLRCDLRFMGVSGILGLSGVLSGMRGSFFSSVVDCSVFEFKL